MSPRFRRVATTVFAPVERHEPHAFAEHALNPLKIEVHTRIAECLPATAVDITSGLVADETMRPGINPYASRVELLRHILLHTAGNMRAHALRFIQPYDIARLGRLLTRGGVARTARPAANAWWIYPPLSLAERCVPGSIPPEVLESFRAICPRRAARARAEERTVRGELVEPAGSPPCRARSGRARRSSSCGSRRVASCRIALRCRNSRRPSRSCRRTPGMRWYGVSHVERILRWIFSRPPRVQTMIDGAAAATRAMTLRDDERHLLRAVALAGRAAPHSRDALPGARRHHHHAALSSLREATLSRSRAALPHARGGVPGAGRRGPSSTASSRSAADAISICTWLSAPAEYALAARAAL